MKAHLFFIALISCLLLSCADKQTTSENADTTETEDIEEAPMLLATIPIKYEETQKYEDMLITVMTVDDSRCAPGTNCAWPGAAMVFLKIQKGKETRNLTICDWDARKHLPDCDNIKTAFGFVFKVDHVLPYPTVEHTPSLEEYQVSVQIGK